MLPAAAARWQGDPGHHLAGVGAHRQLARRGRDAQLGAGDAAPAPARVPGLPRLGLGRHARRLLRGAAPARARLHLRRLGRRGARRSGRRGLAGKGGGLKEQRPERAKLINGVFLLKMCWTLNRNSNHRHISRFKLSTRTWDLIDLANLSEA